LGSYDTVNDEPLTGETMTWGSPPVTCSGPSLPSGEPFTVTPVKAAMVHAAAHVKLSGTSAMALLRFP
jgi:hypothetical protein